MGGGWCVCEVKAEWVWVCMKPQEAQPQLPPLSGNLSETAHKRAASACEQETLSAQVCVTERERLPDSSGRHTDRQSKPVRQSWTSIDLDPGLV